MRRPSPRAARSRVCSYRARSTRRTRGPSPRPSPSQSQSQSQSQSPSPSLSPSPSPSPAPLCQAHLRGYGFVHFVDQDGSEENAELARLHTTPILNPKPKPNPNPNPNRRPSRAYTTAPSYWRARARRPRAACLAPLRCCALSATSAAGCRGRICQSRPAAVGTSSVAVDHRNRAVAARLPGMPQRARTLDQQTPSQS